MLSARERTQPAFVYVLVATAWVVWLSAAAIRWRSGAPLGHDEARYALAGRDLLAGDQSRWNYVPPGMELIALPGILAGGSEYALRIVPILLSSLFLLVMWRLSTRLGTNAAGAVAIIALAANSPLEQFSSDLLSDVPSATCIVLCAYVLYSELQRPDGPTRRLIWTALLAAVATYIRYGSCIYVGIITVVAAVVYHRAIIARPKVVLATLAVFALAMSPHIANAVRLYGTPWGTLSLSSGVPPSAGPGLPSYATHPFATLGAPAVLLFPAAVWQAIRSRLSLALLCTALFGIVALSIKTLSQPRYVFVSVALLTVVGASGLQDLLLKIRARSRAIAYAAIAALLCIGGATQIYAATRYRKMRVSGMIGTIQASAAISASHGAQSCFVLGRHQTQLEWYCGCTAVLWPLDARLKGSLVFAVRDNTGGPDQPDPGAIADLSGRHSVLLHIEGLVDVVRIDPVASEQ